MDHIIDDLGPKEAAHAYAAEELLCGRVAEGVVEELVASGWSAEDAAEIVEQARLETRGNRGVVTRGEIARDAERRYRGTFASLPFIVLFGLPIAILNFLRSLRSFRSAKRPGRAVPLPSGTAVPADAGSPTAQPQPGTPNEREDVAEWKHWARAELARGHDRTAVVNQMIEGGWSPGDAEEAVTSLQGTTGEPAARDVHYARKYAARRTLPIGMIGAVLLLLGVAVGLGTAYLSSSKRWNTAFDFACVTVLLGIAFLVAALIRGITR